MCRYCYPSALETVTVTISTLRAVLARMAQPQVTITVSGRCRVLTGRKRRGWHTLSPLSPLHLGTWPLLPTHCTAAQTQGVTSWSRNRAGACSTAALQQCGHSPLLSLPSSAVSCEWSQAQCLHRGGGWTRQVAKVAGPGTATPAPPRCSHLSSHLGPRREGRMAAINIVLHCYSVTGQH